MATKKMQDSGKTGAQLKKEGQALKAKGQSLKMQGAAMKKIGLDMKPKTGMDGLKALAYHVKNMGVYKTGGMVNSNAKVSAIKTAGSKGVKSGVNTKVSAQNSPKGRTGGTNKSVPRPTKG